MPKPPRAPAPGKRRDAAEAFAVRFRLERSYRPLGYAFAFSGVIGFVVSVIFWPLLLLLAGPSIGIGLWLLRNDIREYLVVEPRARRLKLVLAQGKQVKERRDYSLRQFVRLEIAQYDARPKGVRCMILLFRPDGSVEKVDDRIHEPRLVGLCREVAAAAELDFIDKGRIDQAPPPVRQRESHRDDEAKLSL